MTLQKDLSHFSVDLTIWKRPLADERLFVAFDRWDDSSQAILDKISLLILYALPALSKAIDKASLEALGLDLSSKIGRGYD